MTSPRVVLITGANSGVGLATAKTLTFALPPYHVILTARTLAKAQAAILEITTETPLASPYLTPLHLDVTNIPSITAAVSFVSTTFTHLDALLNNTGVGSSSPDVYTRFRACMDVNVIGCAVVAEMFRPLLLKAPGDPYSLFISSGAGSFGRTMERLSGTREKEPEPPNADAYCVSKAAVNMLALREHVKWMGERLKVFAVSPGFVVSGLRGESEEQRSGWGKAEPASGAGELMLSILDGERDGDVGRLIRTGGVDDW